MDNVKLSTVSDPGVGTGHIIYARVKDDLAVSGIDVKLYQGQPDGIISPIATLTIATLTTSFVTNTYTLSSGEANSISDYSNLYLEFVPTSVTKFNTIYVSEAWLEVPGAGGGGTGYLPSINFLTLDHSARASLIKNKT